MNKELLEEHVQDLSDGVISTENYKELEQELLTNPEAMELYLDHVDVVNLVELELESRKSIPAPVVPVDKILKFQKKKTIKAVTLATAALVLVGFIVLSVLSTSSKSGLEYETSPGTKFTITHSSSKEQEDGVMKSGSKLVLTQGAVKLKFANGVQSIVMAPAEFTLRSDDELFLKEGTAWFEVPKEATGFKVVTKELDIIDLGTEFGVFSHDDEHDEVHVFKGKVMVNSLRVRKDSATLTAGNARRIDSIGRLTTIPLKVNDYLTELPNQLPNIYWSFDKKDGLQAQGTHPVVHSIKLENARKNSTISFTDGPIGTALAFHSGDHYLVSNWAGFKGERPRTICCWVKIAPNSINGENPIIAWGDPHIHNGKLKLTVSKESSTNSTVNTLTASFSGHRFVGSTEIADGKWHHVAVASTSELDSEGLPLVTLYVDGKKENTLFIKGSTLKIDPRVNTKIQTHNAQNVTIGSNLTRTQHTPQLYYKGCIDELYIFDGYMDQKQIKQIMDDIQP